MKKNRKKTKYIGIGVGILSIVIGLFIFYLVYSNYQEINSVYSQSVKVEGSVFNVRHMYGDMYRFEYKYFIGKDEYKAYVSEMKFENGLKDNDTIDVYYEKDNPTKVLLTKPTIKNLYIAIIFLALFILLGLFNIFKNIKR